MIGFCNKFKHFKYWLMFILFCILIVIMLNNNNVAHIEGFKPLDILNTLASPIYRPQIRNAREMISGIVKIPDTFKNRIRKMLH